MAIVETKSLTKQFGDIPAVTNLSSTVCSDVVRETVTIPTSKWYNESYHYRRELDCDSHRQRGPQEPVPAH